MNNTLKKPNNLVPIPEHLTPETQAWVAGIREKFVLESHHDRLLILAAEAWDRSRQARAILDKDGLVTQDRHGRLSPHPLCAN